MKINSIYKILKNKRILITGNSGFVGTYLSLAFYYLDAKVLGFALKKKNKNYLSNFKEYKSRIKTINSDLKYILKYKNYLKKFKPEIIIHLASQPIVKDSYLKTISTYETNVMGTVKLLEIAKDIKSVKNVIVFTSDKVYARAKDKYLDENSKLGGSDPYSSSKSSQDIISRSYKESFFLKKKNLILIRAGNIIGGGDWQYKRLIPDIFNSIYKNKKIILRNPNAVRPWQHILDVINGILLLIAKKMKKIESKTLVFNIGPDSKSNISVIKLIKKIKEKNKKIKINYHFKKIKFNETKILKLSNSLFKKKIGWKQKFNIDKSVELTSEWYRTFFKNKKKIFYLTENQIKDILK